jgi:hypothetical protein
VKSSRSALNDAQQPPRDFGALAQRISAYTSRVLLSAVVVVAGIGFGRQVLRWWRDDATDVPLQLPAAVSGLGRPSAGHEVIVGDRPWSIVRQPFEGDAAAASRALLAACRNAASEIAGTTPPAPGPEERELLARLAGSEPELQIPGGISLYALPDGFPMVVGTLSGGETAGSDPKGQVEGLDSAVALWGIAVPVASTGWSLYTFHPEGRPADREPTRLEPTRLEPPLPPGSHRLLQVRAGGGDATILFTGPRQPDVWKAFYDRWAAEVGLQNQNGWQESGGAWLATYRSSAPGHATVEVHFDQPQGGQSRGVILVGP